MCLVYWFDIIFFFFKQKTAYEMRISDWSSDVCSSDLLPLAEVLAYYKDPAASVLQRRLQLTLDALDRSRLPADEPLEGAIDRLATVARQIGRASCRERVCQYV